ncbi:hypothetical protein LZ30DRAFT_687196 [Colletotrichum cereale]|nr:hypothetical protein LZ30DRAFT_687196 [Colletotrichum cereale]
MDIAPDAAADDLPESIPDFFGNDICYSPGCAARLPDTDKLRNAQNFALFAVDVLAFPNAGKPASSSSCSKPNKREVLIQAQSTIPRNSSSTRRQRLPSKTPSSSLPRSSSTRDSPSSSSTKATLSSTTSSAPSSSSAVPATVSNGATLAVTIRMVVVGGVGGGLLTLGGKTIPIAAGQTIVVSQQTFDEANPENPKSEDIPRPTTLSVRTTRVSSSAPSTTSSCPAETSKAFKDDDFNCRDLHKASAKVLEDLLSGIEFGSGPVFNESSTTVSTLGPTSSSTSLVPSTTALPPPPAPTKTPVTVYTAQESAPRGSGACFPGSVDVNIILGGQTEFKYQFTGNPYTMASDMKAKEVTLPEQYKRVLINTPSRRRASLPSLVRGRVIVRGSRVTGNHQAKAREDHDLPSQEHINNYNEGMVRIRPCISQHMNRHSPHPDLYAQSERSPLEQNVD